MRDKWFANGKATCSAKLSSAVHSHAVKSHNIYHTIFMIKRFFIFTFSSLPHFHAELRSLLIASRAITAPNAGAEATAANSNRTSELAAQFRLKPEDVALLVRYNVLSLPPTLPLPLRAVLLEASCFRCANPCSPYHLCAI
jgi:hypothetical protein